MGFLDKLLGSTSEAQVKKLMPMVKRINELEGGMEALTDKELRAKTDEFRARLNNGETEDDLLPEAFAVVREAAKRTIGQRHYDVQLLGGIVLHQGRIAEMKTGEGKTITETLPAYLNALSGHGVHIVTVNDYLAERDAQIAELQRAVVELSDLAPVMRGPDQDSAELFDALNERLTSLETRMIEQDRTIRHTLTMLIEWVEEGDSRRDAA